MAKRGRKKGTKNKPKGQKVTHYYGHFLIDSGLKIEFDVGDEFDEFRLMNEEAKFPFESNDLIYLGSSADTPFIRPQKVVGFQIDSYEVYE